jgi:hypothetical protein
MDLNIIRAGIFLTAGLGTIIFRKQLNNLKNRLLEKLNFKKRDEKKSYIYLGILFIVIAIILFVYSIIR